MSAALARERGSRAYPDDEAVTPGAGDSGTRHSAAIDAGVRGSGDRPTPVGADDARYARVRADVEARLRRVCVGMPPELFAELVHDICERKVRWARDEDTPVS